MSTAPPAAPQARTPAAEFFACAQESFNTAVRRVGELVERRYQIGPYQIALRFAGQALLPRITPALEHLAVPGSFTAAFTIDVFDSLSTQTKMPPAPWDHSCYGKRGEVMGFNSDEIHINFEPGVDVLQMLDEHQQRAIYWVAWPELIPWWETTFPFRMILHWWMRDREFQPLHAGAVGIPGSGVLIAGKSGSGKSTTTLACLDSGLLYAGDDYVLARTGNKPFVYSLYNTAKLEPDNLRRFPALRPYVTNSERLSQEKAVFFLNRSHPQRLSGGFPVAAILVPRVTGNENTRLTRNTPGNSLIAIAATTFFHLQGARREGFRKIAELVNQTPSYTLELGTDLKQIPERIKQVLQSGGEACH